MAKTLVTAAHDPAPAINGHDNCFARTGSEGRCPGEAIAKWLNGLGEDDEQYGKGFDGKGFRNPSGIVVTNGIVRDNYLRENKHVIAKEPALAQLRAEERRLSASLRIVKKTIKRVEAA